MNAAVFKETTPKAKKGRLDAIYLTSAVTHLRFEFFRGSHRTSDQSKWEEVALELAPGDAVLWYDKLVRRVGPSGNGAFINAQYDV